MRACPKCSLLSPDSAVMCDCGHPFDTARTEAALAIGFRPRDEVHPPGPSKGAKFGVGLLGLVIGGLPLGMLAEYQAALGHGENGLLRALGYVTGSCRSISRRSNQNSSGGGPVRSMASRSRRL